MYAVPNAINFRKFLIRHKLRIVDLSYNNLTMLPETIFMRTSLEIFNAAYNQLKEIPVKALNPVQSTLKQLNLEGNHISTISNSQLNQIQSLVILRLSNNRIATVDDDAFCCLPNLNILDISFNPLKRLKKNTFDGVRTHLQVSPMETYFFVSRKSLQDVTFAGVGHCEHVTEPVARPEIDGAEGVQRLPQPADLCGR